MAKADDARPIDFSLEYSAEQGCPDEAAFEAALRARLPAARRVAASETSEATPLIRVRLPAAGTAQKREISANLPDGTSFRREVPDAACVDAMQSMAVIAAMALEANQRAMSGTSPAAATQASVPKTPPGEASPPAERGPRPVAVTSHGAASVPAAAPRASWQWSALGSAGLEAGMAPNVAPAIALGLELRDPSLDSARRTGMALGLSASVLATVTSGTAGATAGLVGASLAAPVAASNLLIFAAQWLAIGLVSGLGLAGGASWINSPSSPTKPPAQAHATSAAIERPTLPGAVSATSVVAAEARSADAWVAGGALPSPRPSVHPAPAGRLSAPSALLQLPPDGRLGREVRLIDEARRAMAAGNAQKTLDTLDEYAAADGTGTLDREAQILRIDALVARGEHPAAVAQAQAYLRAFPADPHAPRLQAVIDSTEPGAP